MNIAMPFVFVGVLLALAGCAPIESGRPFSIDYVDQIIIGKTSKNDVLANLGKPSDIKTEGSEELWQYSHMSGFAATVLVYDYGEGHEEQLAVAFKGDVVSDCLLKITNASGQGFAASVGEVAETRHCGKRM